MLPEGQFVVLHHTFPDRSVGDQVTAGRTDSESAAEGPEVRTREPHFDLMVDSGDELLTWALFSWPPSPAASVEAIRLPPHRRRYLTYDGPLSGDRGSVQRIDEGRFRCVVTQPGDRSLEINLDSEVPSSQFADGIRLVLTSPRFRGTIEIAEGQLRVLA